MMTVSILRVARPEFVPIMAPLTHQSVSLPPSDISKTLFDNVRVYCFIISTKNRTEEKARHVQATWAKRCNKHVFVTANEASGLPSLDFGLKESRVNLFAKIEHTLKHIYKNELNNYDFFLKADYDTYVVMENLRFMLLPYSPDDPLTFGCRLRYMNQYYMSGGAGYVLSREAIRRIVEKGFGKLPQCAPSNRVGEDVEIGECMNALNVKAVDTRDRQGRHRMVLFSPSMHLVPKPVDKNLRHYMANPYEHGEQCCGDYIVSFHYINTGMMYVLDALFYRLRRVGSIDEKWNGINMSNGDLVGALRKFSVEQSIVA
uniref:N-acetylgalactosaminide beta-1,3-galactosyltransferase n=1 Tax=Panagrellus redivivus TaxID=6233 RepID=A0A7E4VJ40_PANRE